MKALVLLFAPKTLVDLTIQLDPPLPTVFSTPPVRTRCPNEGRMHKGVKAVLSA
jgi:hypothetical protein